MALGESPRGEYDIKMDIQSGNITISRKNNVDNNAIVVVIKTETDLALDLIIAVNPVIKDKILVTITRTNGMAKYKLLKKVLPPLGLKTSSMKKNNKRSNILEMRSQNDHLLNLVLGSTLTFTDSTPF